MDLFKYSCDSGITVYINNLFSGNMLNPLMSKSTCKTNSTTTYIDSIYASNMFKLHEAGILYADISDHLLVFVLVSSSNTNIYNKPMLKKY